MSAAIHNVTAEEFLRAEQKKDILRLVTAGSVDDGKSTLIGRLLYDSQSIYEDQLHAVRRASRNGLELALLTDGLRAEREQGITIDVAYRYFSTAKRKFILADAPGHEQYTRNMATGASNADLAILLIDASRGIQPQSKRHAHIIGLLGIAHLVVVLNKMDLVDYSEAVFDELKAGLWAAIGQFKFESVDFFPISANAGTNVVSRSKFTPWYGGPSLLDYLETIEIHRKGDKQPFRFPVQRVQRAGDFRGYSGQITSGAVSAGDSITVLPSGRTSRVKSLVTFDGTWSRATVPQSVTITLDDELDISRGDLIASTEHLPFSTHNFRAQMIWFAEKPLDPRRTYLLKHTTQTVPAEIAVESRLDISTLSSTPSRALHVNDIGTVLVETSRSIFCDRYRQNRSTGSFIIIDPASNNTVAAGMIVAPTSISDSRGVGSARGRLLNISHHLSVARLVHDAAWEALPANLVPMSKWNHRAAELLSSAGFHVLLFDAPAVVGESISEAELLSLLERNHGKV